MFEALKPPSRHHPASTAAGPWRQQPVRCNRLLPATGPRTAPHQRRRKRLLESVKVCGDQQKESPAPPARNAPAERRAPQLIAAPSWQRRAPLAAAAILIPPSSRCAPSHPPLLLLCQAQVSPAHGVSQEELLPPGDQQDHVGGQRSLPGPGDRGLWRLSHSLMSRAPGRPGVDEEMAGPIFHERQRLELCAIHALNNVLQYKHFSQETADEICKRLSPDTRWNPHRSVFGTGNYDVNVIMAALQSLDLAAVWWDKRRSLEKLVLSEIHGFILNIPSNISLGIVSLPIRRKHWIAVRQVHGLYYNLDSKLKAPAQIGDERAVREFLQDFISQGPCEVLLVVRKDVEETGKWMSTD